LLGRAYAPVKICTRVIAGLYVAWGLCFAFALTDRKTYYAFNAMILSFGIPAILMRDWIYRRIKLTLPPKTDEGWWPSPKNY
jgi:hypothetical protein